MPWAILILAGAFEVAWAIGLKKADGFTKLWPSVWTIVCLLISTYLLALAVQKLPVGTAYAVWTGIGAIGTAVVGMAVFGEPRDIPRMICLLLIAAGIVGLKLFAKSGPA